MLYHILLVIFTLAESWSSRPGGVTNPFKPSLKARQAVSNSDYNPLEIDLGYSVYQGYANQTSYLNIWKGIRFAAPPTGSNRWQMPQPPSSNRTSPINASSYAPICYQSPDAMNMIVPANQSGASEDCLFLNVWSPSNATGPLPVLVWIHGGGYGQGSGRQDLSLILNVNNNSFVGVTIQYRLGAFGFLSSDEVFRQGTPNAGIYDQHFALQWIQSYIHLFNGNASHVTIAGESAGGGSVMLQDMAYGGTLGTSLFTNTISASPYLPMQYGYKDWIPSQSYYAFASQAGCPPSLPYGHNPQTIFECLVNKDVNTLQNASAIISQSGVYGTWSFLPVTDGRLIQDLPSRQLQQNKVNGLHALVGNNANEGPSFTPQNITTESSLLSWLKLTFPLFSPSDISKILLNYPLSNNATTSSPLFATKGDSGPTALDQSSIGVGQQQRADNIYAETTFVCPSYWQAEAYSSPSASERSSYKYQYSVPPALHGQDLAAYFSRPSGVVGPDMSTAFKTIWGNFIRKNNPSISPTIAAGASSSNKIAAMNPISNWPAYSIGEPYQINLNQTGGTPLSVPVTATLNITVNGEPGLKNDIRLVNAYSWEGGRGERCDFWRSVGDIVPE